MKIRRSVFWFCIIVVILITAIFWFGKENRARTSPIVSVGTNAAPPTGAAPSAPANILVQTNTPPAPVAASTPPQDKGEQMKEGLNSLNDVPIAFYGRLEDQFGSAVFGAQIMANVRIYNGVQSTVEHLTTVSDGNGMFQIQGGKGESLGIMPKKEGYVLASTGTEFKYSYMYADHFTSDPNNPTVIKMWKLQGAEPLLSINQRYKFHYTDSPVNFDLIAGKIVATGGDVKITLGRSPGVVSERTLQDWSVLVEGVNGGLIESDGQEGITFEAPESGYQANDSFIMSATAPHRWFGSFDQTFFLQSRNGQVYSKVNFGISINQQPNDFVWVEFHGVANTNSSRNWEATAPQ
jgi:hypothetical protein